MSPRACFAVGSIDATNDDDPFVLRWNGTQWSVSANQDAAGDDLNWLQGVSCARPTDCVAVGQAASDLPGVMLRDHWDGHAWTLLVGNRPGIYLNGVSCVPDGPCLAVGTGVLAQHWSGTAWSTVAAPESNPSFGAAGVTCFTATDCLAVAGNHLEHWNGTTWHVVAAF
ncbi:MAG: hypothetical protein ACLPVY_14075 [Acidimicrobiia bacterium]